MNLGLHIEEIAHYFCHQRDSLPHPNSITHTAGFLETRFLHVCLSAFRERWTSEPLRLPGLRFQRDQPREKLEEVSQLRKLKPENKTWLVKGGAIWYPNVVKFFEKQSETLSILSLV